MTTTHWKGVDRVHQPKDIFKISGRETGEAAVVKAIAEVLFQRRWVVVDVKVAHHQQADQHERGPARFQARPLDALSQQRRALKALDAAEEPDGDPVSFARG